MSLKKVNQYSTYLKKIVKLKLVRTNIECQQLGCKKTPKYLKYKKELGKDTPSFTEVLEDVFKQLDWEEKCLITYR